MNGNHLYAFRLENYPHIWREYFQIVKHSKNIIDLLETGDYINGQYVERINYGTKDLWAFANYHTYDSWHRIVESEIESIVTHEQFKSIEYKI